MTLTLKPKIQKLIDDRVKSGKYRSKEEVIAAALHSLDQRERWGDFEPGELDELCRVGLEEIERGEGLDGETVLRELAEKRKTATASATKAGKTRLSPRGKKRRTASKRP